MFHLLIFMTLILTPILFGLLAYLTPDWETRKPVIVAAVIVTPIAGILLAFGGNYAYHFGRLSQVLAFALEILVIGIFLMLGWRIKNVLVLAFAGIQMLMVLYEPFAPGAEVQEVAQFVVDPLAIILVLVVSLIGSLIVLYGIGYMEKHEHHAPKTAASTGRFFFFLIGFLGFMNGLVLANDLTWFSVFWELTTLCSFMLISHDGTPLANQNALRAVLMNLFGGVMLTLAVVFTKTQGGGEAISTLMASKAILPMAFLALAAFTKSAQLPFQSWLLGAMVAPTPVSALLHSSTMVKAGSYLILRLSPAFMGTAMAPIIAVAGAFTFAFTSALAIGQSNGKKVLAYSTIANLGLIVACAGIGTPVAYAAGVMILCFHALSKALLFLCMGNIEQTIGSREIEEMMGLMVKMPVTTVIAIIGMISMFVPPFSMLVSKWIAIEAAVDSPVVLILLVIGSALTLLFWAKWIGRIVTAPYGKLTVEPFALSMIVSMGILVVGVVIAGFTVFSAYNSYIIPIVHQVFPPTAFEATDWKMLQTVGEFLEWPLFTMLVIVLVALLATLRKISATQIRPPFLCGENVADEEATYIFRSVMDKPQKARLMSYYFTQVFGEDILTQGANLIAIAIILLMFGIIWKP